MTARPMVAYRNATRLEDLQWLAETGESARGAARRLGLSEEALERWCVRHCPDLYRVLRSRDPERLP